MSNYWMERQAAAQQLLSEKSLKQVQKQLKKYYGVAAKRVVTDFENTYNKLLLTMAQGKQPTPADLYKLDKYWQMQGQLRKELNELGEKQISTLTKNFEAHFLNIYNSIGIEGINSFSTIDKSTVSQLISQIWCADGKAFSQRVWENTQLLVDTLNEELLHCVITGKKTTELKQILQERFNQSYFRAETVARTEISHIQNTAAQKRYIDYGLDEFEVWADEDERRCEQCGKLHKKRFPIGSTLPVPAHPRCRCSIIPVID